MKKTYKLYFCLFFVLTVSVIIYYPGLKGGYILDDASNLSALNSINGDFSLANIKKYVGNSNSGPLKRPISIFSFLIDGSTWPTNPWSFKRTNLFIHIVNGLLLFALYYKIFRQSKQFSSDAGFIAVLGLSLWLLHPFLVSSVLYIVQRMAILVMTFVLTSLLLYVNGRHIYEKTAGKNGSLYMLFAMYTLPILAVLCKENGILLVYYIILMEVFVFRYFLKYKPIKQKLKFWLYLPAILTTVAFLVKIPSFIASYYMRDFSLFERILTQFRAITTYLYHIFVPKYFTQGAYTDGFNLSHGLFEPISTILSVILVLAILATAWLIRKTNALISFSIFFFFTAHLLESTIIPLELYFEHRNYVPMLFVFIPVILILNKLRKKHKIVHLLVVALLVFISFITFLRSSLWGDDFKLHLLTMNKYPESTRAITMTAIKFEERNKPIDSYEILKKGVFINDAFEIKISYLNVLCVAKLLSVQHLTMLYENSKNSKMTRLSVPPYSVLFNNLLNNNCGIGREIENSKVLLKILEENSFESNLNKKPLIYFYRATIDFKQENFKQSQSWFIQSFLWKHSFENVFAYSYSLLIKEQPELALEVLNIGWKAYQEDYKYSIDWLNYEQEFNQLRYEIEIKQGNNKLL